MPGWRSLPGGERLTPPPRAGNLSQRFRQYGTGAVSLLKDLLKLDWRKRINAMDALKHTYFKTSPFPANPSDLPTFEDSHELDRRRFNKERGNQLPPAPKGGTVGRGAVADPNAGFNGGDYGRNGPNGNRYQRNRPPAGEERQPAWHRERGLPPRPPPPVDYGNGNGWDGAADQSERYRDRDRPPRSRAGGGASNTDTYIPSYDRDAPRPPREERRHREEWDDRRYGHERDRRRPEFEERSRASRTRSRSRSPIRERERDVYRR